MLLFAILLTNWSQGKNMLRQGKLVCLPLMREVVVSCPDWVIPKTIIRMVQTASRHGTHAEG